MALTARMVRFDHGRENLAMIYSGILATLGIQSQLSPAGVPKMNSRVERVHYTVQRIVRDLIRKSPDLIFLIQRGGKTLRVIRYRDLFALLRYSYYASTI